MPPLLVIGSAACVFEDLEQVDTSKFDVAVVNDMGVRYLGPIAYWATLHTDKIRAWRLARAEAGGTVDYEFWGYTKHPPDADHVFKPDWGGSSGLFAVQVGLKKGYGEILLAGIPMTPIPHFNREKPWTSCNVHKPNWLKHERDLKGKVRSLSGWTKDLLGGPVSA